MTSRERRGDLHYSVITRLGYAGKVSARPPDADLRLRMLEAAAHLIADEGSHALSARRIAAAAGTSTMAVYTHFGGMEELRRAIRREGFDRLTAHLAGVEPTGDSLVDLARLGAAYCLNALAHPDLYRVTFLEGPIDLDDAATGLESFAPLVGGVQRCADEGTMEPGDAWSRAIQLWTGAHGMLTAHFAGLITLDGLLEHFAAMGTALFIGYGADRERSAAAVASAAMRTTVPTASPEPLPAARASPALP